MELDSRISQHQSDRTHTYRIVWEALIALRTRVQATPSLPIGLGGIGRGLVYLSLPVATWGGKGFAEALLNRLFYEIR